MDEKLRAMDRLEIETSALSHGLPLGPEVLPPDEADDWAMRINDNLAAIVESHPGKFVGFGSLGFGDVRRCVAEVDRCVNELGFKGFQVFSNIGRKMLDAPELQPVFTRIADLGVPVHLHPTIPLNAAGMDSASLYLALGFPYDSSLNTIHLIQSGFFDRVPHFKLIVAHAGGLIPYLQGRIETYNLPSLLVADAPSLDQPLGHYLKMLYVDTVCYHVEALQCCYRMIGASHMLYGTDHPFGAFQSAASLVEQLDCPGSDRELIYHGNAERLLGLETRSPVSEGPLEQRG
jgi:aminocarboxymuconate-semialdehyde decarboxylase